MKITRAAYEALQAHAAEGYPNEICGVLVGSANEQRAIEAKRARNTVVDRSRDRYELDATDHMRIQREADAAGLDIVGYYHSHPDHPAKPSLFDAERAWAGLVYVIVSVERGRPVDVNGFVADRFGGPFRPDPEPLEVT